MKKLLGILLIAVMVLASFSGCARAEFEVSSLAVNPSEIVAGEPVIVEINIANVGNAEGIYTASLTVDGNIVDTKDITVAAGATEKMSFTSSLDTAGAHIIELDGLNTTVTALKPAEFKIAYPSITPEEMIEGQEIIIETNIINIGEVEGTYAAMLNVNGIEKDVKEVKLAGGETETLIFTFMNETSGSYNIDIGGTRRWLEVLAPSDIINDFNRFFKESYSWQAEMTMDMEARAHKLGEVIAGSKLEMDFDLDTQANQMKIFFETIIEAAGQETGRAMMEMYILEDIVYMRTEVPGETSEWLKEELPPVLWESLELALEMQFVSQMDVSKDAKIYFLGIEKVDGIDCYVFDIIPTKEGFLKAMLAQEMISGEGTIDYESMQAIAESMEMTTRQWFAQDTHNLTKAEMTMTMDLTSTEQIYIDVGLTMYVRNYNQPINIELPEAARMVKFVN